jgi:aryl-alcohol dehydrogenase-like predicted oxidoreductase
VEYRPFGRTGLDISAIGFGCWEIGGTYGRIDAGSFQRAVAAAIDSGITCFDAALDDIVRQGKARYVGVSNFRLTQRGGETSARWGGTSAPRIWPKSTLFWPVTVR